uniref:Reverse transcriptase domain-containing protein n=1 Tax=Cuerna arida TaxID=1464854 RepID=A0A1B6EW32_9HEMI
MGQHLSGLGPISLTGGSYLMSSTLSREHLAWSHQSCYLYQEEFPGLGVGSVQFVLFSADLPIHIDTYSHTIMFADGSVFLTSNKELKRLEINNFISISKAMEYCANNDMVFNESKLNRHSLASSRMTSPVLHVFKLLSQLNILE